MAGADGQGGGVSVWPFTWLFRKQITLAVMEAAGGVNAKWELPDSDEATIRVWPTPNAPNYVTYWCGDEGLLMLSVNGYLPAKRGPQ